MTPKSHERLVVCREVVARGGSKQDALEILGVTKAALDATLTKILGYSAWPPEIGDDVLNGAVEAYSARRLPDGYSASLEEIERGRARAAAIRAERDRWLDVEREKYSLPRRRRSIDEMPA